MAEITGTENLLSEYKPGDVLKIGEWVVMRMPADPTVDLRTRIREGESPRDAAARMTSALVAYVKDALR